MKREMKEINMNVKQTSDSAVLDITATGRYWRSSRLEQISLIVYDDSKSNLNETIWHEVIWTSEKESDEYDMLTELAAALSGIRKIITFNGNSFDIPHLKRKYEAYGMEDPFYQKDYRDLYLEYRELYVILGLPSRKLNDYAEFLKLKPELSDAEKTLAIMQLDSIRSFLDGNWQFEEAWRDHDLLCYRLQVSDAFPVRISFHDAVYHVILEDRSAYISVQIIDETIRRYYTDISQYVYLPMEGYAIHKSMASFVAKEHKEKAVRENCFSVTSYSDLFLTDEARIQQYLITVLQFLQTR